MKSMYCPRCAEANVDNVKFCRACGEDLSVIAQMMNRSFPVSLLSKMDAYLARKNERLKRDSFVSALSGAIFFLLFLYHLLVQKEGLSLTVGMTFLMACFLFFWSAWDFLVYKRSLSQNADELLAAPETKELRPQSPLSIKESHASVTERTTRHLDAVPKGQDKSR
nr:zinc-ribbon domain protein [uncultured bacterium]